LKGLIDTIRFSDPVSSPSLASIENKINDKISSLRSNVENNVVGTAISLCGELEQLFAERNRACKLSK
jgi:hypothetical protein